MACSSGELHAICFLWARVFYLSFLCLHMGSIFHVSMHMSNIVLAVDVGRTAPLWHPKPFCHVFFVKYNHL